LILDVAICKLTSATVSRLSDGTMDEPTKSAEVTMDQTDAAMYKLAEATVAKPIEANVPIEASSADNPTKVAASTEKTEPTFSLPGLAPMTYESALDTDINCVSEAAFWEATTQLSRTLWE
jgi:hypothetical protein